ncbi:MAG: T9SS type A sorting domain-containing protein, partial [Ignavibacteria bacterium]|nr:T9SS type A sorting domain-containing protein [Ignavibacteria bacterium]
YLASTGEGNNVSVKIWKISDGSLIHTFTNNNEYGGLSFVEFSPNGLYLYNALSLYESGGLGNHALLRFYEVATGNLVREYIDSLNIFVNNGVRTIGLSPTGNNFFAYSTGYANTARLRLALTDLDLVNNSPIPVELVSFTASVAENATTLSWKTGSEVNNSGFEIQRKKSSDWERIGFVEGQGTTTEEKTYLFTDENLTIGTYQYRLKQIDYDGRFEFSDIVEVEILTPIEFSLSQNYPNPFNPSTKISFQLVESGFVSLKIYDVLGNEISTLVNEELQNGSYEYSFEAIDLTSGIYFYKLKTGSFVETKKMILLN